MILQHYEPDDFVIITGETRSERGFCEKVFKCLGIIVRWKGERAKEKGIVEVVDTNYETLSESQKM